MAERIGDGRVKRAGAGERCKVCGRPIAYYRRLNRWRWRHVDRRCDEKHEVVRA